MPQMNPIWWTWLFIMFILTILLANSLNYFYSNNTINKNMNNKIMNKSINWKW
uniref:ATP synthase complex subunit 8 n=1 Tax=Polypsocus corruptus TaxID=239259 RepID=A0A8K1ZG56_9NEOP|nr:ATP synthase F0 subunit 8 [Polypsocus corruptus]